MNIHMEQTLDPQAAKPGIVSAIIHPPNVLVLQEASYNSGVNNLIRAVKGGLHYDELEALRAFLDLPMDKLASFLGIAKATLHRRKGEGRLDLEESDRVIRFARLMRRALEALETEENARAWLVSSQYGLGGDSPLQYARTECGAREVEDLLTRIEHGVYS